MIRSVKLSDSIQICEIYNYYILNSVVTFEEKIIDVSEIEKKIKSINSKLPWIVYEENGQILGYAYANEWKLRSAYKRTVESSIYLKQSEINKGIGFLLYSELLKQLANLKIHVIIGGISLPNNASIALHEKFNFKKIAHFKEVGFKFNEWVDVGYWQLILPE